MHLRSYNCNKMSTTGVLPFVRSVDFSRNDFSVSLSQNKFRNFYPLLTYFQNEFPENLCLMSGLQMLKLDRTDIKEIPEELARLGKLEFLSVKNNEIEKLYGVDQLQSLRSLNIRRNKLKTSGVPNELFNLFELTTLDLSHNRMKEVPEGLEKAKSLLVLNLSHNQ